MRPSHFARIGAFACALAACAVASAQTMNDSTVSPAVAKKQKQEIKKGDPARWYKPDNTKDAQMRNKEKDIAAALREEQAACRKMSKSQRAKCQKDARLTYEHDMSNVRGLVASAPVGGVTTRTTITSEQPAGIEATGSSQGGATQGAGDQGMQQQQRDQGSQDRRQQETGTQDGQQRQ